MKGRRVEYKPGEVITFNGQKYLVVPGHAEDSCEGCCFHRRSSCPGMEYIPEALCETQERSDEQDIIFEVYHG